MERETRGYSECLGGPPWTCPGTTTPPPDTSRSQYLSDQPAALLARAQDSFDSDLKLKDPPARETLKNILQTLVSWTEKITRDSARST